MSWKIDYSQSTTNCDAKWGWLKHVCMCLQIHCLLLFLLYFLRDQDNFWIVIMWEGIEWYSRLYYYTPCWSHNTWRWEEGDYIWLWKAYFPRNIISCQKEDIRNRVMKSELPSLLAWKTIKNICGQHSNNFMDWHESPVSFIWILCTFLLLKYAFSLWKWW